MQLTEEFYGGERGRLNGYGSGPSSPTSGGWESRPLIRNVHMVGQTWCYTGVPSTLHVCLQAQSPPMPLLDDWAEGDG